MSVFAPGLVLDERFEVMEEVGAGGMGVVYRARDNRIGRTVALKALREQLVLETESIQRFQREARLISLLKHPNIMEIFSVSVTRDGIPYFSMEFLDGEQLSDLLERDGPLHWRTLLPYMIDVCNAMQYAHEQNIVHRDIKPSNIMLVSQALGAKVVKVVDFGIAKSLSDTGAKLTKTNVMMGSVPYLSPSDFSGALASPAGDVYALGCTMVELLTGRPPFVGESIFDTMTMHASAPIPKLKELNPSADVPEDLQTLTNWMLQKNAEDRAPSAVAVRDCLQSILDGKPLTLQKEQKPQNSGKRSILPPNVARCAIPFVVACCVAGFFAFKSATEAPPKARPTSYLTSEKEEQSYVARIKSSPEDGVAYARLGCLYGTATPRHLAAASQVLNKALSFKLPSSLEATAFLIRAANEAGFGDYDSAIRDCQQSLKFADAAKGNVGQQKVLLYAYTPALRYDDEIKLAKEFFALHPQHQNGVNQNDSEYNAIYVNTIEALIHQGRAEEALKMANEAAPDDQGPFSARLLGLVARNILGQGPTLEDFENARAYAMKNASEGDRGLIDITVGWGMTSKPEMNQDGQTYVVKGAEMLMSAPPDPDISRQIRLFDTADRYLGYFCDEIKIYNGEQMAISSMRSALQKRRAEFVRQALTLDKPLPIRL